MEEAGTTETSSWAIAETCEEILMAVLADLDPGEDEPA
jgi:hypothetical protein